MSARSAARKALSLRTAPPRSTELAERGDLLWIETEYLQPDPAQPRKDFDEDSLRELAESLADVGVLTPLRVRPADPDTGMHTITDGERRWRASQQVGIVVFPCLVEAAEPDVAFLEAYLANLHRDALSPIDAAVGLQHIRELFGLASDDEVASKLKKSLGWVRQMNAVLSLDVQTRRVLQERDEPIAIAVGLRPQSPGERHVTLDAIADLPSRDAKVAFISRVNDQRRAGLPIDEAVRVVAQADDAPSPAPETSEADAPARAERPRGGRPSRMTVPFSWRDIGNGVRFLDVIPSALATSRLAPQRSTSVEQWTEALRADLVAFRDLCADAGETDEWERVVGMLAPVLDTAAAGAVVQSEDAAAAS